MKYDAVYYFTTSRVCFASLPTYYAVGDYVEVNFDGVVRQLTARGSDSHGTWVEFSPPLAAPLANAGTLANWKANSNLAIDLRVQSGSPAIGGGQGGSNCGSTLIIQNFKNGGFDGDSQRDIPVWPPQ